MEVRSSGRRENRSAERLTSKVRALVAHIVRPPLVVKGPEALLLLDDNNDRLLKLNRPRQLLLAERARQHAVGEEEDEEVAVVDALTHSCLCQVVLVHVAPTMHAHLLENVEERPDVATRFDLRVRDEDVVRNA